MSNHIYKDYQIENSILSRVEFRSPHRPDDLLIPVFMP